MAAPRWASRILAPGFGYMPTAADSGHELTDRALSALRKAGVV